jgi:two-component system cell cycle response regulator
LNDTLGHAAGDALLRSIGQLLRSTVRGEDVAFRCGGDEFVILLPGCDAGAGRVMADRLVSLTDALGKTVPVPLPPRLSIGIASLSSLVEQSPESLMAEADKQLYAVKAIHHAQSRRLERASWVCPLAN